IAGEAGDRSRYREPIGNHSPEPGQCALRCLWAAASIDYVPGAEPVSRGDGSGAAIPADAGSAAEYLFEIVEWDANSAGRVHPLRTLEHAAGGEPPGASPIRDDLVQPGAGSFPGSGDPSD